MFFQRARMQKGINRLVPALQPTTRQPTIWILCGISQGRMSNLWKASDVYLVTLIFSMVFLVAEGPWHGKAD